MRRGLALVRVSKVGDRGDDLISPELQTEAIRRYTQRHDITIVDWVELLDESGSQRRSKWWETLDQAITRVETERLDVVLVWKFSRAARHRLRWAIALDRIEQAGATLESATEELDASTSTGRFTRGMLAEIAAFEADRIGDVWKDVKRRRVTLGLGDGQPRFGYDVTDGLYVPNGWAPTLTSLYEQRVDGVSHRQLSFWLRDLGGVTRYGNPYTPDGLSRMLRTGFGAGYLWINGLYLPAAHEAVVHQDLWQAYLATAGEASPARGERYELSGILRCAYCGKWMHAAPKKGYPPGTLWVCSGRVKRGTCEGGAAWGPKVTRLLTEWAGEVAAGRDPAYQAALRQRPKRQVEKARRRLLGVEADLLDIARKNQRGFYNDDTYLRLRAELLDEQRILTKHVQEGDTPTVPAAGLFEAALSMDPAGRNGAWKLLIDCVLVMNRERPKYKIEPRWPH